MKLKELNLTAPDADQALRDQYMHIAEQILSYVADVTGKPIGTFQDLETTRCIGTSFTIAIESSDWSEILKQLAGELKELRVFDYPDYVFMDPDRELISLVDDETKISFQYMFIYRLD